MSIFTTFLMIFFGITTVAQTPIENTIAQAHGELYAGHYRNAADLFRQVLNQDPRQPEAVYGLVSALLHDHLSKDAYTAAADGLENNPQSSAVQAAAGMVAFRRGQLPEAEKYFRTGIQLNPNDPGALTGLARAYEIVSRFKTAHEIRLKAYQASPGDPSLMLDHADSLKGEEKIHALEQILALYDPSTRQARSLRSRIAILRSLGDKTIGHLASPYAPSQIKLSPIQSGLNNKRGVGLKVQFNGKETVTLLLDTGASGISLAPAMIQKVGLQAYGDESFEIRGIGEQQVSGREYLASRIKIGPVEFENYPVTVFQTAKDSDADGLIGADVFREFIVSIDFTSQQMSLAPRPNYQPGQPQSFTEASASPAAGFSRVYRFGDHIVLPTSVNGDKPSLFLLDSGASSSLIDTNLARQTTDVSRDQLTTVRGVQGKTADASRARFVNLHFANFQQNNSQLLAIDLENVSESMGVAIQGVLGMPILSQLKITIDYFDGSVRFDYPR